MATKKKIFNEAKASKKKLKDKQKIKIQSLNL